MLSTAGVWFIKSSILAFISRLAGPKVLFQRFIWGTALFVTLSAIGVIFTATFNCRPLATTWNSHVNLFEKHTCGSARKGLLAWAIITAATDVWMVILPSALVWDLHMPERRKIGIMLVFSCALVATSAGIAKAATLPHSYSTYDSTCKSDSYLQQAHWLGAFVPVLISGQLELCFGLIAASLPALNFWLSQIVPKMVYRMRILSKSKFSDETIEPFEVAKHLDKPSSESILKYSYPQNSRSTTLSAAETDSSFELVIQPLPATLRGYT
jgi:hypothetical protein